MSDGSSAGAVYVQTNETRNRVIAFRRGAGGELSPPVAHDTGGSGDDEPHLASQGSVALSADGRSLLVTNVASDDISVFRVDVDGVLTLLGRTPVGPAPKSVAEHGGLVYALATGGPKVVGFRLADHGLVPIAGAERTLASDIDPAQVGFTPDGSALLVTERGTDSISTMALRPDGTLGTGGTVASSGPTPYGFAINAGGVLVVTEAFRAEKGAAAASSYRLDGTDVVPITRSVGNGRSEICWVALTRDGRFAFTTNFADGAVSRYSIAEGGSLELEDATAALTVDGRPGLRDEALSADGRYLYAIDADSGSIYGWSVDQNGALSPIGSWDGLPTTVAGLAAR